MEKEETGQKDARTIVVVGVDKISKQFLLEALVSIISLSGYSVNATPIKEVEIDEVKEDFHVVIADDFDSNLEERASLVFSSFRNPEEVIAEIEPDQLFLNAEVKVALNKFYELTKWMRSIKLAYTMDYNHVMNENGLHNYANLQRIVQPLQYAFVKDKINDIPIDFFKVKATELIEKLVPQLKEMSDKAKSKFEETKKEKNGEV